MDVEGKDLRAVWNRCAKKGIAFPIDVCGTSPASWHEACITPIMFGDLSCIAMFSPPNVLISFSGEVKLTISVSPAQR